MSPFGLIMIGIFLTGLTVLLRKRFDLMLERYNDIIIADYPGEEIIGEENVTENNWKAVVKTHIDELERILSSQDNWADEFEKDVDVKRNFLVQSKKVSGVYAVKKTPLTRAAWYVQRCNDQKIFDFLISVEGFGIIDPFTSSDQHKKKPLYEFQSSNDSAETSLDRYFVTYGHFSWPLDAVDFLVLNSIQRSERLFVSKSVQSDAVPGASSVYRGRPSPRHRAATHFGLKVSAAGPGQCRVGAFQVSPDVGPLSDPAISYLLSTFLLFPTMRSKIEKLAAQGAFMD
mmetsp:Transcript_32623/g.47055  ORF Transcript_32623/g.47055 Transcript_32623/m.47055 type:complete len:287 (-) Transcript_32623:135-995(-)